MLTPAAPSGPCSRRFSAVRYCSLRLAPIRSRLIVTLFGEAFFDFFGFGSTLVKFSPILLAGLAVALPLKAGLFNVGAEGQIYIGALFCTLAALFLPFLHPAVHLPICIAAGAAGGALWAFIAGWFKAYRGINEVIVTLLLNYVGINIVSYAAGGPLMEEGAPYPYSSEIPSSLHLPFILAPTDAHLGASHRRDR